MATEMSLFFYPRCAIALLISFVIISSADAADRPNRSSRSDVAAGQWIDSLLDPSTPMPKRKQANKPRPGRVASPQRYRLRGKLVKNPKTEDGLPPYALVDKHGGVLRYIEPVKSVNLDQYLEKTIAVKHDTGDMLLASQLALPQTRSGQASAPLGLQLAQNLEPIPAGEPVPAGKAATAAPPVETLQEEPIYLDGGYEDGLNFGGCTNCGDMACGIRQGGCGYGARGVMYLHGEYLLWTVEGMNTPPLIIADDNGAFSSPDIIYGDDLILEDGRSGGRITFGLWLDDYGQWAIEGDYFALGKETEVFAAGGNDGVAGPSGLFIGRPFFNTLAYTNGDGVNVPRGTVQEEVDTQRLDGTVTVRSSSELRSFGLRLRHGLCCADPCGTCCGDAVGCGSGVNCGSGCGMGFGTALPGPLGRICKLLKTGVRRTDVLYGVRYVELEESLHVNENLEVVEAPNLGTTFIVNDMFDTENEFIGGEIGFTTEWERNRWSLRFLSKLAVGNTQQRVSINGNTVIDGAAPLQGGLLAQPRSTLAGVSADRQAGNIGDYERNEFSMIPELGLTLGYNITPRLKLTGGYTLLYWSNVLRPGDQIDIDINGTQIPSQGAAPVLVARDHPRFEFRQTDIWAQGLNLGAEYTW